MQIIQSQLGSQVNPLGLRSPIVESHRLLLKKADSSFLNPIVTPAPLVTVSKFLLARKHQPFLDQLIDWDNRDNEDSDTAFPVIEFDPFDGIQQDNGNYNNGEKSKANIPNILPTRSESYSSNNISPELNLSAKATKSTKPRKTQSKTKSQTKSKSKKSVKSSANKKVEQVVDEITTHIHHKKLHPHNDRLSASQADGVFGHGELMGNGEEVTNAQCPMPQAAGRLSLSTHKGMEFPAAFDELQVIPESVSTLSSAESSTTVNALDVPKSMTPAQQNPNLDSTTSDLAESSPIEPTSPHVGETHTVLNNLANNEQPLMTEASLVVDVSDIPVSLTSPQQQISTSQTPAIADNQSTTPLNNLIIEKEGISIQKTELLHPNSSFEENAAIEADLISNSTTHDAVIDNAGVNNAGGNVDLLLTNTSPSVEDASTLFRNLANDEQPLVSELPSTLPSLESAETVNAAPVVIQPLLTATTSSETAGITTTDSTVVESAIPETAGITTTDFTGVESAIAPITSPETAGVTTTDSTVVESAIAPITSPETVGITTTDLTVVESAIAPTTSPETAGVTTTDSTVVESAIAPITSPETVGITTTDLTVVESAIAPTTSPETAGVTTTDSTVVASAIAPTTSPETAGVTTTDSTVVESAIAPITSPETVGITARDSTGVESAIAPTTSSEISSDKLPAPQGYATGGQVTASSVEHHPQIAPSDTVPAMLTPGEFVINATDAQKNLHILRQINSGATPENVILPTVETPNLQTQAEITSPETPTKVDTFADTSIQRQNDDIKPSGESNSFTPASLGVEIGKHRLSMFSTPQLNLVENTTSGVSESSPHYSSPTLIFRKPNPATNTTTNTPSQWSSVEELLNGSNFGDVESNWQNSEFSQVSQSSSTAPQIFAKRLTTPRGFADGGEVTAPDIARDMPPINETIQSLFAAEKEDNNDDANLEILAHEIYHRLRQRIEIERERHGISLGRLPW